MSGLLGLLNHVWTSVPASNIPDVKTSLNMFKLDEIFGVAGKVSVAPQKYLSLADGISGSCRDRRRNGYWEG